MRVVGFVGASGTGKSHRAQEAAKLCGADAIIDDGLLISDRRVIAGVSAKKAPTKLASVRQALFFDKARADEVRGAIGTFSPECIMILGTSENMTRRIASALGLGAPERYIYVEEIASPEQIETARHIREKEGKHVIPVPEFEIKSDFSGYFLHPLRFFKKGTPPDAAEEKTIVRPTFSYLGDYTISDNVIISAVRYEAMKEPSVHKVTDVGIRTSDHGAHLDVTVIMNMCESIPNECIKIQHRIREGIERNTAINVRRVHIYVKSLYFGDKGILYKLFNR